MHGKSASKLPPGIRERNGKIQIDFYWHGKRCRETLQLEANPKNFKYAAQLRAAILFDISQGIFDYNKYFPESKNIINYKSSAKTTCADLFKHQLDLYERRYENGNLTKSTIHNYRKEFRVYLMPSFGHIELSALTPQDIRRWLYGFNHASKTINNAVLCLRKSLKTAVDDGLIAESPLDKVDVAGIVKDVSTAKAESIDPFNEAEKELIINTANGQIKNLIQFAFYSGLRTGELIALRWVDIDFKNNLIFVQRNIILNTEKQPKTKSGIRKVVMLPKAKEALQSQFGFTGQLNDFVFHNPNTNKRWLDAGKIRRAWKVVLESAGVRYRYPYQTRHSYASMLLSNGENIAWIATQLGHINTEMVIRNYGKFIPDHNLTIGYKLKGEY